MSFLPWPTDRYKRNLGLKNNCDQTSFTICLSTVFMPTHFRWEKKSCRQDNYLSSKCVSKLSRSFSEKLLLKERKLCFQSVNARISIYCFWLCFTTICQSRLAVFKDLYPSNQCIPFYLTETSSEGGLLSSPSIKLRRSKSKYSSDSIEAFVQRPCRCLVF